MKSVVNMYQITMRNNPEDSNLTIQSMRMLDFIISILCSDGTVVSSLVNAIGTHDICSEYM
jgi:hypothetical protein